MRGGISMESSLESNDEINLLIERFVDFYSLRGLMGFQFILTKKGAMILEANPRVQGTMVASLLSGVNLLWLAVKRELGLDVSPRETSATNSNGRFARVWGGVLKFSDDTIIKF
jgi:carbamoyl-phosphate synthase large subunit